MYTLTVCNRRFGESPPIDTPIDDPFLPPALPTIQSLAASYGIGISNGNSNNYSNITTKSPIDQRDLICKSQQELNAPIISTNGQTSTILQLKNKTERVKFLINEWEAVDGQTQIVKDETLCELEVELDNHKINLLKNSHKSIQDHSHSQIGTIEMESKIDEVGKLIAEIEKCDDNHSRLILERELLALYDTGMSLF